MHVKQKKKKKKVREGGKNTASVRRHIKRKKKKNKLIRRALPSVRSAAVRFSKPHPPPPPGDHYTVCVMVRDNNAIAFVLDMNL